ncbi:hypothetical protein SUDANB70_00536 [Streptomyces sp. enrichment culture]
MPLGPTDAIVGPASRAGVGVGVGAVNVVLLEHAEAIVSGAEAAGRPVILQISENTVRYHGALPPIGPRHDHPGRRPGLRPHSRTACLGGRPSTP